MHLYIHTYVRTVKHAVTKQVLTSAVTYILYPLSIAWVVTSRDQANRTTLLCHDAAVHK